MIIKMPHSKCRHCELDGWAKSDREITYSYRCNIGAWHAFRRCTPKDCMNYSEERNNYV